MDTLTRAFENMTVGAFESPLIKEAMTNLINLSYPFFFFFVRKP